MRRVPSNAHTRVATSRKQAMIYSCGLRLSEGVSLLTSDIDSARLVVHVRAGKGGRDRYVPLPQWTLELLRAYWRTAAPRPRFGMPRGTWLFANREATGPLGCVPSSVDIQVSASGMPLMRRRCLT